MVYYTCEISVSSSGQEECAYESISGDFSSMRVSTQDESWNALKHDVILNVKFKT